MKTLKHYKVFDGDIDCGYYECGDGEEKVSYTSAEELIHSGIIGFCGCGAPDESLLYILKGLALLDDRCPDGHPGGHVAWYEKYVRRCLDHFGSEEARSFFLYWADKEGYAEHGGSVYGCWLTDKGLEMLGMLRQWDSEERLKQALPEAST